MIELSPQIVAIIMGGGLLLGVAIGYPLAFVIGGVALIVGYVLFGAPVFGLMYVRIFDQLVSYTLLAIPLFVFMATMLSRAGLAERLYEAFYLWLAGFRGGLAIITVLIGTIVAACVGNVGASVTMLTLIALPPMVMRGYSKQLACGSVCAGGSLGTLIPPSIMLVIYGPMAAISVGKLFAGAIGPGLLLSGLYCSYIAIRAFIQPKMAPALPREERAKVSFRRKTFALSTALIPPGILILAVLGSIFMGIAPPTEAAAVGALASTLLAIGYRKLSWQILKDVAQETLWISSMILFIGATSFAFTGVFLGAGCGKIVENAITTVPGGAWGSFALMMFVIFILGFFIDWIGIIYIIVPIFIPIAPILGFNPLWFGLMIIVNFQLAYMTPPFAWPMFYVRGCAPPELGITMGDIIKGVIPFAVLIVVGIGLCIAFPQIILWLPSVVIK
jgi:tripartite ATP-independent transporter DctM subunit